LTDQSSLNQAFASYARTISRRYDIGEVLYQLTDQVVDVLGVDGAGVSLADRDGGLTFVTATDDRVTQVEEQQVEMGEGPCQDAHRSGDRVTAADLGVEQRWPRYAPGTLALGFRAVAGIPMLVEDHRVGALNLYARDAREWPADVLEVAQLLADMATGYILNARTLSASEALARQLQHALESRIVIEQAKGIVAERHGVATSVAFERIRAHARSSQRKLHDVAADLVQRTLHL
jgi:GAF domain-containing protein